MGGLRLRSRPLSFDSGAVLVLAPHPDDDVLGCGGLLAHRARAGLATHILYLTDGSASHPGHPTLLPAHLATLRRDEALRATTQLGIPSSALEFMNLPDGRLSSLSPEERSAALARLVGCLRRLSPSTLFLPLHDDGSNEHAAAHRLVREALAKTGLAPRVLEFAVWAVWRPNLLFPVWRRARRVHRHAFAGDASAKARAIAAHASQFQPVAPWTRPVLSEDFAASFSREEEFFLEMNP